MRLTISLIDVFSLVNMLDAIRFCFTRFFIYLFFFDRFSFAFLVFARVFFVVASAVAFLSVAFDCGFSLDSRKKQQLDHYFFSYLGRTLSELWIDHFWLIWCLSLVFRFLARSVCMHTFWMYTLICVCLCVCAWMWVCVPFAILNIFKNAVCVASDRTLWMFFLFHFCLACTPSFHTFWSWWFNTVFSVSN